MRTAARSVLLTGTTGLVGRHARTVLEQSGYDIIAVARRESPVICDLLDPIMRRTLIETYRPRYWLHLAWETKHEYFWSAPENRTWVAASLDLLDRFVAAGGRRVVMAGTCAEYDWKKLDQHPITEGAPLEPATPYAAAKHELHHVLAATAAALGFSYAWGRLFFMIGAGEHPGRLVPSVVQALLAGKPAKCTSGHQVRDFIDARDAGAAFAALLESDVTGPVNIATGEPHSVAEVALTLGRLTGRPDLVRLGALPDRPDDPLYLVADTTRLSRDVGFRRAIRFNVMLADALEWWRRETISP